MLKRIKEQPNPVHSFLRLFLSDIREQILKRWYYFVLLIPLLVYQWMSLCSMSRISGLSGRPGFMDLIIYLFYGEQEYIPNVSPFKVRVEFLVMQVLLAYMTAYYPVRDLSVRGRQIFIRVGGNVIWWYSKCLWLMLTVGLFYFVIWITAAILTGGLSLQPDSNLLLVYGEINRLGQPAEYVLYCLLLPLAANLAVLFVQMLLSLLTAPVYGFFIVVFQLLLSFYFYSPLLPGNYQMFNRLEPARENGIMALPSLFLCGAVILICIVTGAVYMKKRDIL